MLKADGSLTCVNAAGEQLLLQRNGLERSGSRLLATDPAINRELSGLIQQVTTVGSSAFIAVPRRNGLRPLAVRISPLHRSTADAGDAPARIALFVTNPDVIPHGAAECIMAAYGLTAAEKRLVDALTAGESLKDAADALGVTEVTLRNRLARVMIKTGTNRQAELVALIMAGRVQAI
jgi:DNA-binding CsgD family transcriptional regulator